MPQKDRQKYLEYHRVYSKKYGRAKRLKSKFGLTSAMYDAILYGQGGCCAVCHQHEKVVHGTAKRVQPLSVDHDHFSGEVRGLLCSNCNTALGLLGESPERMLALASYTVRRCG